MVLRVVSLKAFDMDMTGLKDGYVAPMRVYSRNKVDSVTLQGVHELQLGKMKYDVSSGSTHSKIDEVLSSTVVHSRNVHTLDVWHQMDDHGLMV